MNVAFYIKNDLHHKSWGQILNPGTLNMYKKNFVIMFSLQAAAGKYGK